jgi:cobalt-zinc-cadmium efflux system protein
MGGLGGAPRRRRGPDDDGHGHRHAKHGHGHTHPHTDVSGHGPGAREGAGQFTAREARQARRLATVLAIVSGFCVIEVTGAFMAQSVVLQADALHLLMDVLALGVNLGAMRIAVRRPTPRFTYGLRRAEPVAAIFSAMLVLLTTAGIVVEGIEALHGQTPPRAGVMLIVALLALCVNGVSAALLHDAGGHVHGHAHEDGHAHGENAAASVASPSPRGHALNLRGATLHLLGDTLGAVAALCAALVIRFGGPPAADPIASFAVAVILLYGSLRLMWDATLVLLEAAPPHLPVAAIREVVVGFAGVDSVHDLHVWSLGAGHDAVTVHVRTRLRDPELAQRLSDRLRAQLGVEYATVQVDLREDP